MVVLRDNIGAPHAASHKMSSGVAVAASRKSAAASSQKRHGQHSCSTQRVEEYAMKRRSMSSPAYSHMVASAQRLNPRKRPRTSWGKPHANPALLVCSSLFLKSEEAVSSSTSACDDGKYIAAAKYCNMLTVRSPGEATSFVKTEPLQHLVAVKLEEVESYDDGPLHQLVPTFFSPAMPEEHLLTSNLNAAHDWAHQPACPSSCSWPFSPLSSSSASDEFSGEPLSSSVTVEFSCDDFQQQQLNWDDAFREESCEILSERFYEMEKDMSYIMGTGAGHQNIRRRQDEGSFEERNGANLAAGVLAAVAAEGVQSIEAVRRVEMPKEEIEVQQQEYAASNCDCGALPSLGEEEYRIDLVDFEPEVEVGDEEEQQQLQAECSYLCKQMELRGGGELQVGRYGQKKVRVALSLDYEEVMSAWSDKGSLFIDGSSTSSSSSSSSSAVDYPLDLAAWEPASLTSVGRWMFPEELASKMIVISPPSDGTCVGDDADADGVGRARHARVLRYREKRRTRLFSKKIRYEVRKLNAERRPRMKGRFIKRSMDK
ncbi:hypothetical protein L7F22_052445 [Adiantum nelumboides]|nr:hypothetical protein [Adiantum nelumboides]